MDEVWTSAFVNKTVSQDNGTRAYANTGAPSFRFAAASILHGIPTWICDRPDVSMDEPLGGFMERIYPRCNFWSRVVFDLRCSVESGHSWALPLAALAEVQVSVDTCPKYSNSDPNDWFAAR